MAARTGEPSGVSRRVKSYGADALRLYPAAYAARLAQDLLLFLRLRVRFFQLGVTSLPDVLHPHRRFRHAVARGEQQPVVANDDAHLRISVLDRLNPCPDRHGPLKRDDA